MRLCRPCSEWYQAWYDYRLPATITLVAIGRQDARDIRERQEARFREWRDTVRWQQAHIERLCAERRAREPLVKHERRGRSGARWRSSSPCSSLPSV